MRHSGAPADAGWQATHGAHQHTHLAAAGAAGVLVLWTVDLHTPPCMPLQQQRFELQRVPAAGRLGWLAFWPLSVAWKK